MRSYLYILLLCLLAGFLISCSQEDAAVMNSAPQAQSEEDQALAQLQAQYLNGPQDQEWKLNSRHRKVNLFWAFLTGAGDNTDSQGKGLALVRFSPDSSSLQFKLIVVNTNDVTVAHIHLAPAVGANGPPVLWLYPSAPPPQLIPGTFNGVLASGTLTAANLVGPLAGMTLVDLHTAMLNGLTYVNVHTTLYPGGEIRGDLQVLGH